MPISPNYKQATVAGEKWTRAARLLVENPLNGRPSILFVEEEAINFGGKTITNLSGNLSTQFDENNALHLSIYAKLDELYILLREERDLALAEGGEGE